MTRQACTECARAMGIMPKIMPASGGHPNLPHPHTWYGIRDSSKDDNA